MTKKISIIGVPMDFGQMLRGVDMGPAAIRYTGLIPRLRELGHQVIDAGDINIDDLGKISDSKEIGNFRFLLGCYFFF